MERHDHDSGEGLRSVEEVRDAILADCAPLPPIELPLLEALGCIAAADTTSSLDLPPFASSAMDGFAVRAADVATADGQASVGLTISGRSSIGFRPEATVGAGEAVRIATGSPMPTGADTVVPIEDCVVKEETVHILFGPPEGKHVRPAAEDVVAGEMLIAAGRRIGTPEVGLLAASGHARVGVFPKPRVGVISTGDELIDPGKTLEYGQIYDSNSSTIAAAVRDAGGVPFLMGRVSDDIDALRELVVTNLSAVDVFVTSGGVSVGDRDPVKAAFMKELDFFKVAMQPGMPQGFGRIEGHPFFCLPGNPVSTFVSFEVFVRPALLKMMGRKGIMRPVVNATAVDELRGPVGKAAYLRVLVERGADGFTCASTGGRSSNLISTVARANGLAILPTGIEVVAPGESVQVMVFRTMED